MTPKDAPLSALLPIYVGTTTLQWLAVPLFVWVAIGMSFAVFSFVAFSVFVFSVVIFSCVHVCHMLSQVSR